MFAAMLAEVGEPGSLIVDLVGDQPALCGVSPPYESGATEWAVALPSPPEDAIDRLGAHVMPGLRVVSRGRLDPAPSAAAGFVNTLRDRDVSVVIDCGHLPGSQRRSADAEFRLAVARACDHRLLVTRACYLGLRSATDLPVTPTAALLLVESGRALGRSDVESVVAAPVLIEMAVDPSIARLVDAGLLVDRLPRSLRRCLRAGWSDLVGAEPMDATHGD